MSAAIILHISQLPSLPTLALWRQTGIKRLLNVSGVDVYDIYPPDQLASLSVAQEQLIDVFSAAQTATQQADSQLYLQLADAEQRLALLGAVRTLLGWLQNGEAAVVFCHRGQSRSPLVAAAALQQLLGGTADEAVSRVRAIQAQAQFTVASWSALLWCADQFEAG